jgi:hypothetical protein
MDKNSFELRLSLRDNYTLIALEIYPINFYNLTTYSFV